MNGWWHSSSAVQPQMQAQIPSLDDLPLWQTLGLGVNQMNADCSTTCTLSHLQPQMQAQIPSLDDLPLWQTLGLGVNHTLTIGEAEAVAALEVKARR